jgi:ATP-dependent exoDNAse (exonuclease V) beta subunit
MIELALDTFNYQEAETLSVEGKRVYQIPGDRYYPSITTVLGHTLETEKKDVLNAWKARVGNKKANEISAAASNRGTNTHLMLERYLRNEDPQLETFPPEHVKIFSSLRLEVRKINKVYGQEVVLYSDVLGIAGRCDLVAEYQGNLAIVDYKTSSRVKSADEIGDYWIQAAFYATAHNEMFGTNIEKLVIMMGVENHLPMIFRKTLDDELLLKLSTRACEFYDKL